MHLSGTVLLGDDPFRIVLGNNVDHLGNLHTGQIDP